MPVKAFPGSSIRTQGPGPTLALRCAAFPHPPQGPRFTTFPHTARSVLGRCLQASAAAADTLTFFFFFL